MEHVDFVSELGKGTGDTHILTYARATDRAILTYDDDFVLAVDETELPAVLYIHDARLSVKQVADIVHAVSQHYPQNEIQGLEYLGEEWI